MREKKNAWLGREFFDTVFINPYIIKIVIISIYYIALSHKDWELPNARIWLAEMDIDRGLDFPI